MILTAIFVGCAANTHGNREGQPKILMRLDDVRHAVGQSVTLVGTARQDETTGASIDLQGGAVALPEFVWPAANVGRTVTVTGRVLKPSGPRGERVYRLGEVEFSRASSR